MYRKEITPAYEQVGKRQRLTGFLGEVFDGETRVSCFEYRSYSEAEIQTDLLVYELLSSDMVYSATELDGAQADDIDTPTDEQGPCDDINIPEPDRARCATCGDEGRIPCGGYGDQAGGWAETCPDCEDCDKCACGALAIWEVPFATEPHYEYFCDTCFPSTYYMGDRITPRAAVLA